MTLASDFDKLHYMFDRQMGAGVVFPFVIPEEADLDAASAHILADYSFPFKVRLITAEAFATTGCTTASINPVLGIAVGTAGLASAGLASEISTITCTSPFDAGATSAEADAAHFHGSTTETEIATTDSIWVYVKTVAARGSYPSTAEDGKVGVILWLQILNAPA